MNKPQLLTIPPRHQQFIIEDFIMPAREVHIIAASSGTGKTTLIIQILDDLIEGNPVFDVPTHPIKPVYLCNDRSLDDIQRTFERVQPRHQYPVYSLVTDKRFAECQTPASAIRTAKAMHPDADFVIFDPISFNVENINSAREVSRLLRGLTALAQELNITILIIHHAPKTKSDSEYESPRDKMAGCGAWGGYSNLNMILEEDEKSDPTNPIRGLHVCPRNGTNRYFRYILDENGCFTPAPNDEDDPDKQRAADDKAFNSLEFAEWKAQQLYKACGKKNNGALQRNIKRWLALGCLEKINRGRFLKVKNSSSN
jgi:hypothetical protein